MTLEIKHPTAGHRIYIPKLCGPGDHGQATNMTKPFLENIKTQKKDPQIEDRKKSTTALNFSWGKRKANVQEGTKRGREGSVGNVGPCISRTEDKGCYKKKEKK